MTHYYLAAGCKSLLTPIRAFRALLAAGGLLALLLAWPAAGLRAQVLPRTFAAGEAHSLSIHADGTLWATGSNQYGQLGIAASMGRSSTWVQVGTATNWVQVAAGQYHSLGLRADGRLYAWGSNQYGQLGNAINANTTSPNPTPAQMSGTYTQAAASGGHSLALRADGTLWAWGYNYFGQLGSTTNTGTVSANPAPTQVAGTYTQVAAGQVHSLALRADGSLWAWGDNFNGQLGSATNSGTNTANPTPRQVTGTYTQVAAGGSHSLALRAGGTLWAWGSNQYGELGNASGNGTFAAYPVPTQVAGTYTQVAAGNDHSLGLRADGSLWAWGINTYGQLGNAATLGATTANPTPAQVPGTYTQAVAGSTHSLGLRADGRLYAWGGNTYGQLGSGSTSFNPTPMATGTALVTRSLAMGANFGLAIRGDGTLWAWGNNHDGQLGQPTSMARTSRPMQVGTATDWVMVVAGTYHSLGLRADGSLYAWGNNYYGQLGNATGNNTYNPNPTPTLVAGTYTQVAAGGEYSLGLRADGSLWAWGDNFFGQLGSTTNTGTISANPAPTQVAGTYTQVAAGVYHSLGLRADGSLYAWGLNNYGQLGNPTNSGTYTSNPTPTLVAGTYARVVGGGIHSLGLRADGSLYAWGSNQYGQLGNGTTTSNLIQNPTPAQVAGIYTQVAAGSDHSLGLRADGSLYTWGYNDTGQLGLGNTSTTPAPTQEATAGTGWTTLGTGAAAGFSLVRTASAQSFASTGSNDYGQLGDGTTTQATRFDRTSPLTSLQPLPVRVAGPGAGELTLYPNPAPGGGAATLRGATPGQAVQVLDALGRVVATTTADAAGTAAVAGLPPGVYLVRDGGATLRLAVQ